MLEKNQHANVALQRDSTVSSEFAPLPSLQGFFGGFLLFALFLNTDWYNAGVPKLLDFMDGTLIFFFFLVI